MPAEDADRFPSDDVLIERLRALAGHCAVFEDPGFTFGEWEPAKTLDDGTIQLGWYSLSNQADACIRDAYEAECIIPFDWSAWLGTPRGRALAADPAAIVDASPDDLVRFLTAIVRSDRFSEGSLAEAYESGVLTAILRRASDLQRPLDAVRSWRGP